MMKWRLGVRDTGLRSAAQCFFGSGAIVLLTFVCLRLRLNLATAALLCLMVVTLLSLAGGLVSSVVVSAIAALCLRYLAPPIYSFRVEDRRDVVAIMAFFTTSLVIAGLIYKVRTLANESVSSVRRQLVDAEQRERIRIARELYDDVCQRLTLVVVRIRQFKLELPNLTVESIQAIDELQGQISQISTDVQALAHELHFAKLEYLGLVASMRSFCREFSEQRKVEVDFRNDDLPNGLPLHTSACLLQILQEALRNSAKHSGVQRCEVELRRTSDVIHLAVHDSGLGFNPEAKLKEGALGLVSMQERVKLAKGRFSIDSLAKHGTTVHAWVPLDSINDTALGDAVGGGALAEGLGRLRANCFTFLRRETRRGSGGIRGG